MTARTEAMNVLLLVGAVASQQFAWELAPSHMGLVFTVITGVFLLEIDWASWRKDQ
jgi:hypothetical protein